MDTAITSIVCIALVVVGGMTMSQNFLASVDSSAAGLEEISLRDEEILNTDISPLSLSTAGSRVSISIRNTGQTKLASFTEWDVIIQYRHGNDYYVKWLPYVTGTPGDNQWTVQGIYRSASLQTPELLDRNVLNPGEEIIISAAVAPGASPASTARIVVSTPNGVAISTPFDF